MNVKIPFLFIILILCITFSSFSREVNVTATKIKQFKHTVVSIEGNANAIKDSVISSEVVGVVLVELLPRVLVRRGECLHVLSKAAVPAARRLGRNGVAAFDQEHAPCIEWNADHGTFAR